MSAYRRVSILTQQLRSSTPTPTPTSTPAPAATPTHCSSSICSVSAHNMTSSSEHTSLSTHILDTSAGTPGRGVVMRLEVRTSEGWQALSQHVTNDDGRVADFPKIDAGVYRLIFEVQAYFDARKTESFYPDVTIAFKTQRGQHYHVPLLISPFGFSTYRGS